MSSLSHYPVLCKLATELHEFIEEGRGPPARATPAAVKFDQGKHVTRITWPNLGTFWLNRPQARVVEELLDALLCSRIPSVDQGHLIRASGLRVSRLADLFIGTAAWNTLIIGGDRPGTYRLPDLDGGTRPPPEDDLPDDAA